MLAYLNLTKPRISLLFAVTGLAALIMEGSLRAKPATMWLLVAAIFMIGGSANAFNQYFERDIDKMMVRTAKKRPLPQGKIKPVAALIFSVVIGAIGTCLLWHWGTPLAALLGLGTIVFYSFYYTLWLKPRTPYNIVIGGAAGATGPLIGWAAATGLLSWAAVVMFAIVFFWTPPHFWSLALCCKEDYAKVNYPMFPLVAGDAATRKQILFYSMTLLPLSASLYFLKAAGMVYLISALILSAFFMWEAVQIYRKKTIRSYWQLFGYSIAYLLLLFVILIVDHLIS
ncbi:MAG: protoheme IX farnesyltransferase [Deltaproteobacteria bacterium]|nr:protoheme IX farnesyltransferase [Deltaproteobacteria bacterium]